MTFPYFLGFLIGIPFGAVACFICMFWRLDRRPSERVRVEGGWYGPAESEPPAAPPPPPNRMVCR